MESNENESPVRILSAVFERDLGSYAYTYLGEICSNGKHWGLFRGYPCKCLFEYDPEDRHPKGRIAVSQILRNRQPTVMPTEGDIGTCWFNASEGWKSLCCLRHALTGPTAVSMSVLGILESLLDEVNELLAALELAAEANIRFQLRMRRGGKPPPRLLAWRREQDEELTDIVRRVKEGGAADIGEWSL